MDEIVDRFVRGERCVEAFLSIKTKNCFWLLFTFEICLKVKYLNFILLFFKNFKLLSYWWNGIWNFIMELLSFFYYNETTIHFVSRLKRVGLEINPEEKCFYWICECSRILQIVLKTSERKSGKYAYIQSLNWISRSPLLTWFESSLRLFRFNITLYLLWN